MFTLQEQPNPLYNLLGHVASGVVGGGIKERKEQQRQQRFQDVFSKVPVDASPLEFIQKIGQLPVDEQPQAFKMLDSVLGHENKKLEIEAKRGELREKRSEKDREETRKKLEAEALRFVREGKPLEQKHYESLGPEAQKFLTIHDEKAKDKLEKMEAEKLKKVNEAKEANLLADQTISNLDELQSLISKLTTESGGHFNFLAQTEFNSLATAAGEPIVKLYNPSGPIATQKMKLLLEKMTPSSMESRWVQQGKINALKTLANQGKARALARLQMAEGGASDKQLQSFDAESEQFFDTVANYEVGKIENSGASKQEPKKENNRRINQQTGQKEMKKDGKWIPVP